MKSRFQPDEDLAREPAPRLADPEAFDVSDQQIAASLEEKWAGPPSRFVPEFNETVESSADADDPSPKSLGANDETAGEVAIESSSPSPGPDSWRREVAARVTHYRGKRPRAPRYPSLQLKFENAEPVVAQSRSPFPTSGQLAITMDSLPVAAMEAAATQPLDVPAAIPPEGPSKILEFPRSAFMPPIAVDELAEPVFHRPRILEVPEVLPPPPALGGISIEPSEQPKEERRPGFESPLQPARLTRRILAGMTDAVL